MLRVHSVEETISVLNENFSEYSLPVERVSLYDAFNRVNKYDIYSDWDVPDFNRSTVDGYSLKACETFGSSDSIPSEFFKTEQVEMGIKPDFIIEEQQASYTPTGGYLPEGADSVVMVEYVDEADDTMILVNKPVSPGENVIVKGSDIKKGQLVLKAGEKINSLHLGVLASIGIAEIDVLKELRVGIITTGDEIISPDKKLSPGEIRNSNEYYLFGALKRMGAVPKSFGIVKDNFDDIYNMLNLALKESDIVLITGGSSAGVKDQTANVIDKAGNPGVLIHGISVKPGKPTIIGKINDKPVIGLPGHPGAVAAVSEYFIRHLISIIYHKRNKNFIKAVMGFNYGSNNGRAEFLPVVLEKDTDGYNAMPLPSGSFQLFNLSRADGCVLIKSELEGLNKGDEVEVIKYED